MKRQKDGKTKRVMGQGSREEMGRDFCWAKPEGWSPQGEAQDEIKKGQDEEGYDEKGQNKKTNRW